jgi:hypothetical protein
MATPLSAKQYEEMWNSVRMCGTTAGLDIARDSVEVTTACDAQKEYLPGKYGWTASSGGPADFAAAGADATLFTGVTAGAAAAYAISADTTSPTSANPQYAGSAFVTSYGLSFDQASAVQYTAAYQGDGALARNTS